MIVTQARPTGDGRLHHPVDDAQDNCVTPPDPLRRFGLDRHPTWLAARHYTHFRVAERLLLTGHSHQAWPDVAFRGQVRAWEDAAAFVDGKWSQVGAVLDRVRHGWRRLLDDRIGDIALGTNTHELIVRWLSALPLGSRPRIVTTEGEFHTIRRQLDRLAEVGGLSHHGSPGSADLASARRIEVVRVPVDEVDDIADHLVRATDDRTAAVMVSAVLYRNAAIVPGLDAVARACERHGCPLLVDAYHALNVIPFRLGALGLEHSAFVVGGGYKYCQLGEGNCFLRIPPAWRSLAPAVTGWFAEWDLLEQDQEPGRVAWSEDAALRFAGATFDPTSAHRAAAVFDFFERMGLEPESLRTISQHQIRRLAARFDTLDLDSRLLARDRERNLAQTAGFLALRSSRAADFVDRLRERGMLCDSRGDLLRLGPAPYLSDRQLDQAVDLLGAVAGELQSAGATPPARV